MANNVDCNGKFLSLNPILEKEARKKIDREIRREFAERLRAARKAAGLRRLDVAASLGSSQNAYANYEQNIAAPTLPTLIRLCELLNVTPNELLGFKK